MFDDIKIDRELLEAYSRGEITRRDIEDRTDQAISFGALLAQLHRHNLPLPRFESDPNSPGVRLIRELVTRATRAG